MKKRKYSHYLVEVEYISGRIGQCTAINYTSALKTFRFHTDDLAPDCIKQVSIYLYIDKNPNNRVLMKRHNSEAIRATTAN